MSLLTPPLCHHFPLHYAITYPSTMPSLTPLLCHHLPLHYAITFPSTMSSLTPPLCHHFPHYAITYPTMPSPPPLPPIGTLLVTPVTDPSASSDISVTAVPSGLGWTVYVRSLPSGALQNVTPGSLMFSVVFFEFPVCPTGYYGDTCSIAVCPSPVVMNQV